MKICVNAGHFPGIDPGAVGRCAVEADIVEQIARIVCEDLAAVGCEAVFVQSNELSEICRQANEQEVDLFVSIHCNGADSPEAQGTETYCAFVGGLGEQLAGSIQQQLVTSLLTVDRGVKTAGFYVLRYTKSPAVLVETAFITNRQDEQLLLGKTPEFAHAIARGVTDFIEQRTV